MDIIPLTLIVSLCLTFTFILFFMREQLRPRFPSRDAEALLPLMEETSRAAAPIVVNVAAARARSCQHRAGCPRGENCEHRPAPCANEGASASV
jgi:hypothetical protein